MLPAGLASGENSWTATLSWVIMWPFLCVCVHTKSKGEITGVFSSYKDTSPNGVGPHSYDLI